MIIFELIGLQFIIEKISKAHSNRYKYPTRHTIPLLYRVNTIEYFFTLCITLLIGLFSSIFFLVFLNVFDFYDDFYDKKKEQKIYTKFCFLLKKNC